MHRRPYNTVGVSCEKNAKVMTMCRWKWNIRNQGTRFTSLNLSSFTFLYLLPLFLHVSYCIPFYISNYFVPMTPFETWSQHEYAHSTSPNNQPWTLKWKSWILQIFRHCLKLVSKTGDFDSVTLHNSTLMCEKVTIVFQLLIIFMWAVLETTLFESTHMSQGFFFKRSEARRTWTALESNTFWKSQEYT